MGRPEYDMKETGKHLRQLRIWNGLSVEEVRAYMKMASRQAIYKWEKGDNFPSADNLLALADLYGVRADMLLVKKQERTPQTVRETVWLFGRYGDDYEVILW